MEETIKVAVTGAAGQISYSLLFRVASGQLFGLGKRVHLSLLEIPQAEKAMEGVAMELEDCAFGTLAGYSLHTDVNECFEGVDNVFLVGARPRGSGMERKDLLKANAQIFSVQGKSLAEVAKPDVKVLVVGNPANTNALITQRNANNLDPANFTAMTRLDQNRATAQIAAHCKVSVADVGKVIIWGNHSATQFPDIAHAVVGGKPASGEVDEKWYKDVMIKKVQKRGAEVIEARGLSSAASAASAAIDHMRDWVIGTPDDTWVSMSVASNGEYGMEEGVIYSYPCTCSGGKWQIVKGLEIDSFARGNMEASNTELREEREAIISLLP